MSVEGILELKEGATSDGLLVEVDAGLLPLSRWNSITARFRFAGGGPVIERSPTTVSETSTLGVLSIDFAAGQVTSGIAHMELIFDDTDGGLRKVIPRGEDSIRIKVSKRL